MALRRGEFVIHDLQGPGRSALARDEAFPVKLLARKRAPTLGLRPAVAKRDSFRGGGTAKG
ncbi:hypothetical protein TR80_010095 [Xanthomonas campestris]|nr:hypothetical protein TR80_010095 [Xanthomonas campestris]